MDTALAPTGSEQERIVVSHVIKGRLETDVVVEHRSRGRGTTVVTPRLNLNEMVWARNEPVPARDVPIAEIIEFLVEVGLRLDLDRNPYLRHALAQMEHFNSLGPRVTENSYRDLPKFFVREGLEREVEFGLGGPEALDGWKPVPLGYGSIRVRAFPPRTVEILAGNAPVVPAMSIVRGAISKGVHLLKMPSNDMFTATALLRTMADVDANHPIVRSFSAAYWRGGDTETESALFRSQYFDKLVVWGGEAAVRHALQYVAPGFEMIAFDPKVSISLVGREAFASPEATADAARRAAEDSNGFNQDACSASRFHFVEGDVEEVDRYCWLLAEAMATDTRYGNGLGPSPAPDVRDTLEMYRSLEPIYRVFGHLDGRGAVVRSDDPVDFHPDRKVVNVVRVDRLADAMAHVTVATQSVGIYPFARVEELRDELASAGAQRLMALGEVHRFHGYGGMPHDGMWPIHRLMKWVWQSDVDITEDES